MLIVPSIDILEGECVRLYRGSFSAKKIYSKEPLEIARGYEEAGAKWLHIVDLDAARGQGNNRKTIGEICRNLSLSIEVGGGVRSERDVEQLVSAGVERLILGTVLVKNIERAIEWIDRYGSRFVAGIDALDGRVRIAGWEGDAASGDLELVDRIGNIGLCGIVYTSIGRDGTLLGPDIERTNHVAARTELPVILSGGIGSMEDVEKVFAERHAGVVGVILGKALYEGKVSLPKLITRYERP